MGLRDKLDAKVAEVLDQRLVQPAKAREAALDAVTAEFDRPDYGPGERVSGRVIVPEAIQCRSVAATIRYAGVSCEGLARGRVKDGPVTLHDGPLAGGEELPFDLKLPDPLMQPLDTEFGRSFWSVWLDFDRPKRSDADRRLEIPVRLEETGWPDPGGERPADSPAEGEGSDWDVKTYVSRWSIPRGEDVTVEVTIGDPTQEPRELTVSLRCEVKYLGWVSGASDDVKIGTKTGVLFEDLRQVDTSVPQHTLTFRIPDDAPTSYAGEALAFFWRVIAKEPRRMRRDLVRETAIQVR